MLQHSSIRTCVGRLHSVLRFYIDLFIIVQIKSYIFIINHLVDFLFPDAYSLRTHIFLGNAS